MHNEVTLSVTVNRENWQMVICMIGITKKH